MGGKRLTTVDFIEKSTGVHNGKYDYRKSLYINSLTKLTITCPEHGDFKRIPSSHLRGYGCPKCGGKLKSNTLDFIRKALLVYDNKYSYEKVKYVSNKTKVTITCSEHGDFKQTPNHHLRGVGCPKCAKHGFNPAKSATIYAIRSDCGQYVKIGITNNFEQRFSQLRRATPFDVSVIERIECDGQTARQFEKMFHDKFESAGFTGFDGATEWLRWSTELQYWLRLLK
jgi:Zn finger protein HypA/HybF involved in hydrogenase expression